MRKITMSLMVGLATLGIAGCSLIGPSAVDLRQEAYSKSKDAVEAVIDGDAGALESLFCQNTSDTDQIEDLLSMIDGSFKQYDDVIDADLPVHFVSDTSRYAIYRSEYISSDRMVRIISCARSTYDKKDEGVQYIAFYDGDTLVASAGSVIERYTKNPVPGKKTDVDMDQIDSQGAQRDYDLNVLYYLSEEDQSGFASLFAPEKKAEAEDKFSDIIDFMGPGIESYSVIAAPGGGSEWKEDHWEYMEEQTSIYDIVTSDGDVFEISMNTVFVDAAHPSNEGITYFEIRKVETDVNSLLEHDLMDILVVGKD